MHAKALIYCRVSSQRQVDEGNGLGSQEQRCKVYAQNKGYDIIRTFPDEAISGALPLFQRPAMQKLIEYLDEHADEEFIVIFDDLSRFARDVKTHIQLKAEFVSRGVKLECLNFNFDDSEESEFAELILAASNQYQRKSNRRQVIQKMKARLEKGYWPFCMAKGLINKRDPIHGRILVRREPYASIYKEGIEKFRDGTLPSILDFQNFVNEKYKEVGVAHRMSHETARQTLKEILYAGYVEYSKWSITRMKAKHEGFISLETFEAVQDRLAGRAKPWHRKDYNLDFPLRPYVLCDSCGIPMSGAFNTGRNGVRHPHYYCRGKGCKYIWKSIRKKDFEDQFEALLTSVKPADELFDLAKEVLLVEWNNRLEGYSLLRSNAQNEIDTINSGIDDFVEKAGKSSDQAIVEIYEKKIKELIIRKGELESELRQNKYNDKDFGTAVETVFNVLRKPLDMWQSGEFNDKRTILFMYFEDKLRYDHFKGFGTANLAYPVALIHQKAPLREPSVEMSSNELESKKTF
jgi:site-specific DNA recombinase